MIRNDDWFDRWPQEPADDEDAHEPLDVQAVEADHELVEGLRAGAMPPTDEQVAAVLAAWRRDALFGEPDPAVEDWRIAMHQAAQRAGERERRRLRRERWHRPVLRVVAVLAVVAGPLIRLLARLPWKARSW